MYAIKPLLNRFNSMLQKLKCVLYLKWQLYLVFGFFFCVKVYLYHMSQKCISDYFFSVWSENRRNTYYPLKYLIYLKYPQQTGSSSFQPKLIWFPIIYDYNGQLIVCKVLPRSSDVILWFVLQTFSIWEGALVCTLIM